MQILVNMVEGGYWVTRHGPNSPFAVLGTEIMSVKFIKCEEIKLDTHHAC